MKIGDKVRVILERNTLPFGETGIITAIYKGSFKDELFVNVTMDNVPWSYIHEGALAERFEVIGKECMFNDDRSKQDIHSTGLDPRLR